MKYWFIIHSLPAYQAHPNYIGKEKRMAGKITKVKQGDQIVYYAIRDSVVVGTFQVVGKQKEWADDTAWKGPHICMKIRKRCLVPSPYFLPVQELVKLVKKPISIFPKRKFIPIRFKDRTSVKITPADFRNIEKALRAYKSPEKELFKGPANDENLGAPMDLGVLNYAPTSEQGVVALFAHFMGRLKTHEFVKIEFIRQGFPDACAIEKEGKTFSRKYIEFEYNARNFREHEKKSKHQEIRCDYVVCWNNDYPICPVEVIELQREIPNLVRGEVIGKL